MNNELKTQIEYISVEKLHPHPDNPRKNLGDLTELTDSIKRNGIFQNLTVVPATGFYNGDYTVIIGHRRLAAATAAGIEVVPCIIKEMDNKEQISTMILENMQRSDLTIYEQAQGMQMMLDMGETVESVSDKTGLSKSTVYKRTRLLQLDKDTFKEKEGVQINITDYDRLFEIEDAEKRNLVFKTMGTKDFEWTLNNTIAVEKRENKLAAIRKKVEEFAKHTENAVNLKYIKYISELSDIPDIDENTEYFYMNCYSGVQLYRAPSEEEIKEKEIQNTKSEQKRNELDEICDKLADLFKMAADMRKDFVRAYKPLPEHEKSIYEMVIAAMCHIDTQYSRSIDVTLFNEIMNTEIDSPASISKIKSYIKDTEYKKALVVLAYSTFEDAGTPQDCYCYDGTYMQNKPLEEIYKYLVNLGYEMSEEEKALIDGTHELYRQEDEDEEDEE